jgi:aryl-alcohol dehydrogenase-like predicted oxidoreductase
MFDTSDSHDSFASEILIGKAVARRSDYARHRVDKISAQHQAGIARFARAWVLGQGSNIVPIPGRAGSLTCSPTWKPREPR